VLGLIALLGFMAIAAAESHGVKPVIVDGKPHVSTIVPMLFHKLFPTWFAGIAFATIGIGALVPAAIMSIAAANLATRNVYVEFVNKKATPAQQAQVSKVVSLVVKFGALGFILLVDPQYAIDLQLIGGVIILQTLPAVAIGLFTRWFHRVGLIAGWIGGMAVGLAMLYSIPNPAAGRAHFGGSAFPLAKLGLDTKMTIYAGFVAVGVNLVVAALATIIARAMKIPDGTDATRREDYFSERA
jgi:SSS family solute:Na+ symporter